MKNKEECEGSLNLLCNIDPLFFIKIENDVDILTINSFINAGLDLNKKFPKKKQVLYFDFYESLKNINKKNYFYDFKLVISKDFDPRVIINNKQFEFTKLQKEVYIYDIKKESIFNVKIFLKNFLKNINDEVGFYFNDKNNFEFYKKLKKSTKKNEENKQPENEKLEKGKYDSLSGKKNTKESSNANQSQGRRLREPLENNIDWNNINNNDLSNNSIREKKYKEDLKTSNSKNILPIKSSTNSNNSSNIISSLNNITNNKGIKRKANDRIYSSNSDTNEEHDERSKGNLKNNNNANNSTSKNNTNRSDIDCYISINQVKGKKNKSYNEKDLKKTREQSVTIERKIIPRPKELIRNTKFVLENFDSDTSESLMSPQVVLQKSPGSNQKVCTICFEEIKNKASLNNCDHKYCYECIKQWSRSSNSCPLCKKRFQYLMYTKNDKTKKERVLRREFILDGDNFLFGRSLNNNNNEQCIICDMEDYDSDNALIYCDSCNRTVCHQLCASLDEVPEGQYNCPQCLIYAGINFLTNHLFNNEEVDRKRLRKNEFVENIHFPSDYNNSDSDSSVGIPTGHFTMNIPPTNLIISQNRGRGSGSSSYRIFSNDLIFPIPDSRNNNDNHNVPGYLNPFLYLAPQSFSRINHSISSRVDLPGISAPSILNRNISSNSVFSNNLSSINTSNRASSTNNIGVNFFREGTRLNTNNANTHNNTTNFSSNNLISNQSSIQNYLTNRNYTNTNQNLRSNIYPNESQANRNITQNPPYINSNNTRTTNSNNLQRQGLNSNASQTNESRLFRNQERLGSYPNLAGILHESINLIRNRTAAGQVHSSRNNNDLLSQSVKTESSSSDYDSSQEHLCYCCHHPIDSSSSDLSEDNKIKYQVRVSEMLKVIKDLNYFGFNISHPLIGNFMASYSDWPLIRDLGNMKRIDPPETVFKRYNNKLNREIFKKYRSRSEEFHRQRLELDSDDEFIEYCNCYDCLSTVVPVRDDVYNMNLDNNFNNKIVINSLQAEQKAEINCILNKLQRKTLQRSLSEEKQRQDREKANKEATKKTKLKK